MEGILADTAVNTPAFLLPYQLFLECFYKIIENFRYIIKIWFEINAEFLPSYEV